MLRHAAVAVFYFTLVVVGAGGEPVATKTASGPIYRTIAPHGARPLRGYLRHPGQIEPLPVEPYAWGWFGVAPRSHGGFHRGYYGDLWSIGRTGR